MASPRSMWSGSISLGLLNVPVTIGKATSETREPSFVTVCKQHTAKIDRSERCGAGHDDCTMEKVKAVPDPEDDTKFYPLDENSVENIAAATQEDVLRILDVQDVDSLPLWAGMGTYYIRPNKDVKGSENVFGILFAALASSGRGAIVKWCKSTNQKLCVIHAVQGVLVMTHIPMLAEFRKPGDQERKHWKVDLPDEQIQMAGQLLDAVADKDGFQWDSYEDEGIALRQEAVQRVLDGVEDDAPKKERSKTPAKDIMATLMASVEALSTKEA